MCLKLDNIFFVELVWMLSLVGVITASWYSIGSGLLHPSNSANLFGLNINIVFLFIFAILIWALYNIKYPIEHHRKEDKKQARKKPRKK
ncbi:MAG: hypothetical protein NTY68_03075 [Candidatus Micrarchaeota archaeon]|nr:hypothetical protein [Candidatus Micrarchaeota archaeon]